ncbi:unnamed protein product [Linum trigynum]|uniref:Uncharacterized protein n=1 Tax=Linum trigynum TaxID=586398 RepID=A0AAV2GAV0_9ROSI
MRSSDASFTGPFALGPLVTSLLLELRIHLSPFITITPSLFPPAGAVLDALEIAIEGEDAVEGEDVIWVSSSGDSSSSDDSGLEPFVESLQALLEYGSDADGDSA